MVMTITNQKMHATDCYCNRKKKDSYIATLGKKLPSCADSWCISFSRVSILIMHDDNDKIIITTPQPPATIPSQ